MIKLTKLNHFTACYLYCLEGGYVLDRETSAPKKKTIFYTIGMVLLISTIPLWVIPIIVPFTSLSVGLKGGIITASLLIAEIMFWVGAVLVGKEVVAKFKSYFSLKRWKSKSGEQKADE